MAKRKTGADRYASGRLKPPNAAQRAEIEARLARKEVEFVMQQPHRRDAEDPRHEWLESELGRFALRHKLRREIVDAGREWANIVRLYRVAWGAPVDEHHGGTGSGRGPTGETLAGWRETMLSVEEALYGDDGMNKARYLATKRLCLDDKPVDPALVPFALDGLRVLAVELGRMTKRDAPFHSEAA
jgi:hypothetical protein